MLQYFLKLLFQSINSINSTLSFLYVLLYGFILISSKVMILKHRITTYKSTVIFFYNLRNSLQSRLPTRSNKRRWGNQTFLRIINNININLEELHNMYLLLLLPFGHKLWNICSRYHQLYISQRQQSSHSYKNKL